jgi:cytosine/uracil/thiamine/allantoin permease
MIVEYFLLRPYLRLPAKFNATANLADLPAVKWPAFVSLTIGCLVGLLTSGVIPGSESLHVGICSIQAWLTAVAVYIPLRIVEQRRADIRMSVLEF